VFRVRIARNHLASPEMLSCIDGHQHFGTMTLWFHYPWHYPPPIVLDTAAAQALGYRPVGDYATTVTDEINWLLDQAPNIRRPVSTPKSPAAASATRRRTPGFTPPRVSG
jgi:hypothetical protein